MHPATALDIKTGESWLYQTPEVQTHYTVEFKVRQRKYGSEGGRLYSDAKMLLLKVENTLAIRYRALNFTNQSVYQKSQRCEQNVHHLNNTKQWKDRDHCNLKYLHCMR